MFGRNFPPFNSYGGFYPRGTVSRSTCVCMYTDKSRKLRCQKTGRVGVYQQSPRP